MVYICQSNIPNLFNICVNFVNKQVYYELRNLADCPMVNKMFLNADKTELVFFYFTQKTVRQRIENQTSWKRLYETDSAKYLRIQIAKKFTCKIPDYFSYLCSKYFPYLCTKHKFS